MSNSGFATIGPPWTVVYANSTSQRSFPSSGWTSAATFTKVKGDFELRERISDIEVSLVYETANVENSPDAVVSVGLGFRSEALSGSLPGLTRCGCGCSAEADITGWMPGETSLGLETARRGRFAASSSACALFSLPTMTTDGLCELDCSDDLKGAEMEGVDA